MEPTDRNFRCIYFRNKETPYTYQNEGVHTANNRSTAIIINMRRLDTTEATTDHEEIMYLHEMLREENLKRNVAQQDDDMKRRSVFMMN